jgi:LytS/YehU family sensor histidine kinase
MFILNQKSFIAPSTLNPELQVITLNFIVFLAIAIKQIKRTFFIQQEKNELEKTKLTTELKLREAELQLLKAQIHPHFLFNTLNNLYGLTLEKSEEAPQLVLRLSEMLDYILYRCNEKRVLLSEEIKNLKNYIEIEKVRYSKNLELKLNFPKETGKNKIAPLILLPFIENAFKHGASNFAGEATIVFSIVLNNNQLEISLKNSKNEKNHKNSHSSSGIGLNNVKKRLEFLYPEKHILKIEDEADTFSVNLFLDLD